MVIVYSTPTCAPCRVAEKRLDAAEVPFEKVDLTENPEILANLKERLGVPHIQTPLFLFEDELFGMSDLRAIIITSTN